MGTFSIWHWLIVLAVVVLIFGTKKLRNIGGDVGNAVKEFKNAVNEGKSAPPAALDDDTQGQTIENEARQHEKR